MQYVGAKHEILHFVQDDKSVKYFMLPVVRAALFAGIQFLCMLGILIMFAYLARTGFFETGSGLALLIGGLALGAVACALLVARIGANPKALEGAEGLITGDVGKPDEREIVFASVGIG